MPRKKQETKKTIKKTVRKKTEVKTKKNPKKSKTIKKLPKKKVIKSSVKKEKTISEPQKKEKQIETIGRRKKAIARLRVLKQEKDIANFVINKRPVEVFFPEKDLKKTIFEPLEKSGCQILKTNRIEVLVRGGGKRGQAEAISLAVSRALLKINKNLKTLLKSHGFLTRDPRKKERKKFGLKKARKAPQWSKR